MKPSMKNALLGAAIALSMGVTTSARSAPADIVVTDQDNGKDITLHGSQRLIVRLTTPSGTPYGWSALIVAAIWLVIAAVLAVLGRSEFKAIKGVPQTADTVKKIPDAVKGNEAHR